MSTLSVLQLFCRLLLSLSILVFALEGLSLIHWAHDVANYPVMQTEVWAVTLLCALLLLSALWLMVGLFSRLVASVALTLMLGQYLWFQSAGLSLSFGIIHLLVSLGLALPVLAMGGGRFALYRRGWQITV